MSYASVDDPDDTAHRASAKEREGEIWERIERELAEQSVKLTNPKHVITVALTRDPNTAYSIHFRQQYARLRFRVTVGKKHWTAPVSTLPYFQIVEYVAQVTAARRAKQKAEREQQAKMDAVLRDPKVAELARLLGVEYRVPEEDDPRLRSSFANLDARIWAGVGSGALLKVELGDLSLDRAIAIVKFRLGQPTETEIELRKSRDRFRQMYERLLGRAVEAGLNLEEP